MSCIYGLCDPFTMIVRYVGQTKATPKDRLRGYLKAMNRGSKTHLHRWMRKIFPLLPVAIVLEQDPKDIDEAECRWIRELTEQGINLCNMTTGGEKLTFTEEVREKISKALLNRKMSDIARENMHLAWERRKVEGKPGTRKGIPNSLETNEKLRVFHTGRKRKQSTRDKISKAIKDYWASINIEERIERGKGISEGILKKNREISDAS